MVAKFHDAPGVERDIRVVSTGFKLNGARPAVTAPPPTLGQHAREILTDLGYGPEESEVLLQGGAVGTPIGAETPFPHCTN